MDTIQKLWAIEEIRQVKARFFRFLDTKQWEKWGDVLCEDVTLVREPAVDTAGPAAGAIGREGLVKARSQMVMEEARHFGHMPEIEITSEGTAKGTWSMMAYDRLPGGKVRQSFGWYNDEFRLCDDGQWRISVLGLSGLIQA